jgi:hypothetical protein
MVVHAVIPALRKLRQEDQKFQSSWSYIMSPCFKKECYRRYHNGKHRVIT